MKASGIGIIFSKINGIARRYILKGGANDSQEANPSYGKFPLSTLFPLI